MGFRVINHYAICNKPRANISDVLFNHRDTVNFRMDRTRSEGEINLGVVSITGTMNGREVLRNNVKAYKLRGGRRRE